MGLIAPISSQQPLFLHLCARGLRSIKHRFKINTKTTENDVSYRLAINTHLWLLKDAQIWHFVQEKGDKRGIQQGEYHLYTLPKKIFREKKKGKRKKKEKLKEKGKEK